MGDLNARDRDNTLWICEKILEVDGVDTLTFSSCDKDGNTPLHSAILDRDFELTELILKHCVKARRKKRKLELIVNIKNNEGKTAFDLITSFGQVNFENQLRSLVSASTSILFSSLFKYMQPYISWLQNCRLFAILSIKIMLLIVNFQII